MNTKVSMGLRILLGLFILIFGLNKFLNFIPIPLTPGDGGELMRIYASSGFFSLIGILEILGGLALLTNKFVPLALTIITAIMFNAAVFHGLHAPEGLGGAAIGLILSLVLVYANKERFSSLLSA